MKNRLHRFRRLILPAALLFAASSAAAADRHAGYYYPVPQTTETYEARVGPLKGNDRIRRLAFVTGITAQLQSNPYPTPYVIFAKGEEYEKLIVVATEEGRYNTLYRLRALLALMTSIVRTSDFFQQVSEVDRLTFFDLASMLGFTQMTVSDGDRIAHQVIFTQGEMTKDNTVVIEDGEDKPNGPKEEPGLFGSEKEEGPLPGAPPGSARPKLPTLPE